MVSLLKTLKTRDRILALVCLLLVGGQVFLDLRLPDYTKEITVLINTESGELSEYFLYGGKMLACALISALLAIVVGYFSARIAANFSFSVREKLFRKVSAFGAGEIRQFSTASLITRTTNDITQIQMVIAMGLQMMIKAPIMAVWAIIKIVGKSWELSALTGLAVAVIVSSIAILMVLLLPKFRIVQKQVDDVNRVVREHLTGLSVVRAFNGEEYQDAKFAQVNQSLMETQLFTSRGMSFLFPVMTLVQSALSLGIYWLGAILIEKIPVPMGASVELMMATVAQRADRMGDVVAFSSYAMYVVMSFLMLLMIFMLLPRAQVSAARINEVLNAPVAVESGSDQAPAKERGTLTFDHVSFRYPDASEDCLHDISFQVKPGQTLAIIGATGSGKTTITSLAARLYDATQGRILLDGKDIRDYSFEALYPKLGYVPQKAVLFTGTVADNVTFGQSAEVSEEAIREAIEIAQGADFVEKMEQGIHSEIAQGGKNVSGGQKQRLAIARAIARKPEILIFDDSFSALDYKTDKNLRRALAQQLEGTTCVIVAQRIGTIRNADAILVLDQGRAVGLGTHEELMRDCAVYREIAYSQLSEEELQEGGSHA